MSMSFSPGSEYVTLGAVTQVRWPHDSGKDLRPASNNIRVEKITNSATIVNEFISLVKGKIKTAPCCVILVVLDINNNTQSRNM